MQEIKKKKYRGSFILRFAVICLVAFLVFSLFTQIMQIQKKSAQLEELKDNIRMQQVINADLQYTLDNEVDLADYAERAARKEFGYAKPQEKVFINVGGSD